MSGSATNAENSTLQVAPFPIVDCRAGSIVFSRMRGGRFGCVKSWRIELSCGRRHPAPTWASPRLVELVLVRGKLPPVLFRLQLLQVTEDGPRIHAEILGRLGAV